MPFSAALGLRPVGQKERERDFKTPEGRYYLAHRNTRSDYFLSIQVSYPNQADELRAEQLGVVGIDKRRAIAATSPRRRLLPIPAPPSTRTTVPTPESSWSSC